MDFTKIFSRVSGNADNYRIPSVIRTNSGVLVACCDERLCGGRDNPNRIDKVVRRSFDNGRSWEPQITAVEEHGTDSLHASAAIDPCLVYDSINNLLFMFYSHTPAGVGLSARYCAKGRGIDADGNMIVVCGKTRFVVKGGKLYSDGKATDKYIDDNGDLTRGGKYICNVYIGDGDYSEYPTSYLYYTKSDDDGASWSKPICVDNMVKDSGMAFIGTGTGVGIQLKNGGHKGRLIVPIYYNFSERQLKHSCAVIISDDGGKTWVRGKSPIGATKLFGIVPMNDKMVVNGSMTSESQVIECPNGDIKIFMRNHSYRKRIAVATSKDGGNSWTDFLYQDELIHPICQCSIINATDNGREVTLFLNAADKRKRQNGVIRLSYDYGKTFSYSRRIKSGEFVYSSMCETADNKICILFEGSTKHESIESAIVSTAWIKGEI